MSLEKNVEDLNSNIVKLIAVLSALVAAGIANGAAPAEPAKPGRKPAAPKTDTASGAPAVDPTLPTVEDFRKLAGIIITAGQTDVIPKLNAKYGLEKITAAVGTPNHQAAYNDLKTAADAISNAGV